MTLAKNYYHRTSTQPQAFSAQEKEKQESRIGASEIVGALATVLIGTGALSLIGSKLVPKDYVFQNPYSKDTEGIAVSQYAQKEDHLKIPPMKAMSETQVQSVQVKEATRTLSEQLSSLGYKCLSAGNMVNSAYYITLAQKYKQPSLGLGGSSILALSAILGVIDTVEHPGLKDAILAVQIGSGGGLVSQGLANAYHNMYPGEKRQAEVKFLPDLKTMKAFGDYVLSGQKRPLSPEIETSLDKVRKNYERLNEDGNLLAGSLSLFLKQLRKGEKPDLFKVSPGELPKTDDPNELADYIKNTYSRSADITGNFRSTVGALCLWTAVFKGLHLGLTSVNNVPFLMLASDGSELASKFAFFAAQAASGGSLLATSKAPGVGPIAKNCALAAIPLECAGPMFGVTSNLGQGLYNTGVSLETVFFVLMGLKKDGKKLPLQDIMTIAKSFDEFQINNNNELGYSSFKAPEITLPSPEDRFNHRKCKVANIFGEVPQEKVNTVFENYLKLLPVQKQLLKIADKINKNKLLDKDPSCFIAVNTDMHLSIDPKNSKKMSDMLEESDNPECIILKAADELKKNIVNL